MSSAVRAKGLRKAGPILDHASILALSGGGMRGLFTAVALSQIEAAGVGLRQRFSVFAGTSIGGILAIGLAAGLDAGPMAAAFRRKGPGIFRRSLASRLNNPFAMFLPRYKPQPLRSAIEEILGAWARKRLCDIDMPLLVTAVEFNRGIARVFASSALAAPGDNLDISLLDVAMATSAAPTFFPPHFIGDRIYVDGGLIANSPDIVALQRVRAHQGIAESRIKLLSVGTASYERRGDHRLEPPGALDWLASHDLIGLIMDAQADVSRAQAASFLGSRFYRVDRRPEYPIELDATAGHQLDLLTSLANEAVAEFRADVLAWRRFF